MRKILPCIFAVLILSFAFLSCNPDEWPESDEPGTNADVKYTITGSISLTGDDSFKSGDTISIFTVPEALKKKNPKDFTIALKKDENDDNWTIDGSFNVASGTKLSDVTSLEWGGASQGSLAA